MLSQWFQVVETGWPQTLYIIKSPHLSLVPLANYVLPSNGGISDAAPGLDFGKSLEFGFVKASCKRDTINIYPFSREGDTGHHINLVLIRWVCVCVLCMAKWKKHRNTRAQVRLIKHQLFGVIYCHRDVIRSFS